MFHRDNLRSRWMLEVVVRLRGSLRLDENDRATPAVIAICGDRAGDYLETLDVARLKLLHRRHSRRVFGELIGGAIDQAVCIRRDTHTLTTRVPLTWSPLALPISYLGPCRRESS